MNHYYMVYTITGERMHAAVGYSDNPVSFTAGLEAAQSALAQSGRNDPCTLILLFHSARHEPMSDQPGSQKYPLPLSLSYPSTGNFIAFVGDLESGPLVSYCVGAFRKHASFPSEGAALSGALEGVGWSDHASFWDIGVPAVMVTDTAPFRYAHYHLASDTPDKVDFGRLARVVDGLERVIWDLVSL